MIVLLLIIIACVLLFGKEETKSGIISIICSSLYAWDYWNARKCVWTFRLKFGIVCLENAILKFTSNEANLYKNELTIQNY